MVNVTNGPGISDEPAVAYLPGFGSSSSTSSTDSAQYIYASPAGVVNDVIAWTTDFTGKIRLAVTLAAGSSAWTGLTAGAPGQEVTVWNSDSANFLTLAVQNSGSLSANQFQGSAGSYSLEPGNALTLIYYGDSISSWIIIP